MAPITRLLALPIAALVVPQAHAQELRFDPGALEFSYAEPAVQTGLDRSLLDDLENTPAHNDVTDEGAALGRVLFYDERLSRTRTTSCASCHRQENAFADPVATSRGFRGRRTARNSMSLANVAYYANGRFFWDERGATLEEMVLMPIQDEVEMGMSLQELVERLEGDAGYRWLFWQAYGDPQITVDRIAFSLAQFLRSMVSFQSRFDEGLALAGAIELDFPNLTAKENRGKRIFLGLHDGTEESSCASCHMNEERNGLVDSRHALPVLFQGAEATNNGLDLGREGDDRGLGAVTGQPTDDGKFKAPSLRNVAVTAPYMHDGRFKSLRRVIEHYSAGLQPHRNLDERLRPTGGGGWGSPGRRTRATATAAPSVTGARGGAPAGDPVLVPFPDRGPGATTLPGGRRIAQPMPMMPGGLRPPLSVGSVLPDSGRTTASGFGFSDQEKEALLAFLLTLTDETFVTDPKFSDPFE